MVLPVAAPSPVFLTDAMPSPRFPSVLGVGKYYSRTPRSRLLWRVRF